MERTSSIELAMYPHSSKSQRSKTIGGDTSRCWIRRQGVYDGKEVVYNMGVRNGVIVHRDFVSAKNWAQRSRSFGFNMDFNDIPTMVP